MPEENPTKLCEFCHKLLVRSSHETYKDFDRRRFCTHVCSFGYNWPQTEARFWRRINKDGPIPTACPQLGNCWLWMDLPGRRPRKNKYGNLGVNGKVIFAHRYAFQLHYGEIPDGANILHHCDVSLCVRWSHLYAGDQKDNGRDMVARGRSRSSLSIESVQEIRRRYAAGNISQRILGEEFGVLQVTVSQIVLRKIFKHV